MDVTAWYDEHTGELHVFDVPFPELVVTDDEPVLYGPDGTPLRQHRVPFGFQPPDATTP